MASKMSMLRLAAVALVVLVGSTAAQNFPTCPAAPSGGSLYPNPNNCSAISSCAQTACTCLGGTHNATTGACTVAGTGASCAAAYVCTKAYIGCVNNASLVATPPACLASLKVAIVNLFAGTAYANSTVDQSCRAATCDFFNKTKVAGCQIDYAQICVAPPMTATPPTPTPTTATPSNTTAPASNTTAPASNTTAPTTVAPGTSIPAANKFRGILKISGNFVAILANATARALLSSAIAKDLKAKLLVEIIINALTASSLEVDFTADAVATDSSFTTRLASAGTTSDWLANTQVAYTDAGGVGTLTVQGITATTPAPNTPAPPSSASAVAVAVAVAVALLQFVA